MTPVMSAPSVIESDSLLWRRAVAGEDEAFAELYRRHSKPIYNYLFRRLGDWSQAEDLTAAVFLEAFRRRQEAAVDEEKVVAWLFGIATNLARNRRRALSHARHLLGRVAAETAPSGDDDARAEAREQMRTVLKQLRKLPKEQQDVVALCIWSGLSYEEVSVALSVPVGTVRSRLSRARERLGELSASSRHEREDERPTEVPK